MKIFDVISMCFNNLTRRKVRTLLTIIGVVVGTCAIVVMISLGVAMNVNQEAMLAEMGDLNVIQVYNYGNDGPDKVDLDDDAIKAMSELEGVQVATPFWQPWDLSTKVVSGSKDRYEMSYTNIIGVYPEALELFGYEISDGRFFNEQDKEFTVVLGQYTAYDFIDTKRSGDRQYVWRDPDPITGELPDPFVDIWRDEITLETIMQDEEDSPLRYELTPVGVLTEDWGKGYETSSGIFMDINDLKAIIKEYNRENGIKTSNDDGYTDVRVRVQDMEMVSTVEQQINDMGFETFSMEDIREPMEEQARQQQLMLGGLGFISLFVAAIGITNTMIMSIYERTREIGVMKVLGCKLGNIRSVFLMEAGCIGFFGGVIGIGLSYAISFVLNYVSNMGMMGGGSSFMMGGMGMMGMMGGGMGMGSYISIIPGWLVGTSLIFATLIGLISGFYPANRAVKISALEAIRNG